MLRALYFCLFCLFCLFAAPACRTKSGCEATASLGPKVNRKGEIITKRSRDKGLFPKKMARRMK
jgi:hypothetical protein